MPVGTHAHINGTRYKLSVWGKLVYIKTAGKSDFIAIFKLHFCTQGAHCT